STMNRLNRLLLRRFVFSLGGGCRRSGTLLIKGSPPGESATWRPPLGHAPNLSIGKVHNRTFLRAVAIALERSRVSTVSGRPLSPCRKINPLVGGLTRWTSTHFSDRAIVAFASRFVSKCSKNPLTTPPTL